MKSLKLPKWIVILGMTAAPFLQAAPAALSVFDNGLGDIESPEAQVALLKELGYAGICSRPQNATPELLAALDKQGVKLSASYVTLAAKDATSGIPLDVARHLRALKGRETLIWLGLSNAKMPDEDAVTLIRETCNLAKENGLHVVLYPHVGFKTDTVASSLRLLKLAERPNLGVSFNLCHFLKQNDPSTLEATLKAAAPHLKLVQINGANRPTGSAAKDWADLIRPLGEGDFDVAGLLRLLDELGYRGPYNLQCYRIARPAREHLAQSMKTWRAFHPDN